MLMCNEVITLVKPDGTYMVLSGCSWYDKTGTVVQDNGVVAANSAKVRIPFDALPKTDSLNRGDYLIRGRVEWGDGLRGVLEKYPYRKIIEISDNRRGRFPHLLVTAV